MLDDRKKKIFFSIVENYITNGEPVGSKSLAELFSMSVSSATIRNEMALLTKLGLIDQPHTSAGRIPTVSGIRYFIDNLMEKGSISDEDKRFIDEAVYTADGEPEKAIISAGEILADKLGVAVLGKTVSPEEKRIGKIDLLGPSDGLYVIVLHTATGELYSKICLPDITISAEDRETFIRSVNSELSMVPLHSITMSLIQSVAVRMGACGLVLSPLLYCIYDLCRGIYEEKCFLKGEVNLLLGGYADRRSIMVLRRLAENGGISDLISDKGITSVILGGETSYGDLSSLSVILTPYRIGSEKGTVGFVVPLMSDYGKLESCLEYFAEAFGNHCNEYKKGAK